MKIMQHFQVKMHFQQEIPTLFSMKKKYSQAKVLTISDKIILKVS